MSAATVADMASPDCPLIYANKAFTALTGFDVSDCIGRNCRFLQGEGTDPVTVARLREGLREGEAVEVCLRNYRKSGEPFDNLLIVTPIHRPGGGRYVLGCQYEIQTRALNLSDHLKRVHGIIGKLQLDQDDPWTHAFEAFRMRAVSVRLLLEAHHTRDEVFRSWSGPPSRPPEAAGEQHEYHH